MLRAATSMENISSPQPALKRVSELRVPQTRVGQKPACCVKCLRPNPLAVLITTGSRCLYRHRTRRLRGPAAFEDASCNSKSLDLRLEPGDLGLENRDLVFFLFYRVINIGHVLIRLTELYCVDLVQHYRLLNHISESHGPYVQCFYLIDYVVGLCTCVYLFFGVTLLPDKAVKKPEKPG
jgi:hypothetical protein